MIKFIIQFYTGEYDDTEFHTVPFVYPSMELLKSDIASQAQKYIDERDERNAKIKELKKNIRSDDYEERKHDITVKPYLVECDGYELLASNFVHQSYPYTGNLKFYMPEIWTLEEWFEKREKM